MKLILITLCLLLAVSAFSRKIHLRRKEGSGLSKLFKTSSEFMLPNTFSVNPDLCNWSLSSFYCGNGSVYNDNFELKDSLKVRWHDKAFIENSHGYTASSSHLNRVNIKTGSSEKLFKIDYSPVTSFLANPLIGDMFYIKTYHSIHIYKVSQLDSQKEFAILKYTSLHAIGAANTSNGVVFFVNDGHKVNIFSQEGQKIKTLEVSEEVVSFSQINESNFSMITSKKITIIDLNSLEVKNEKPTEGKTQVLAINKEYAFLYAINSELQSSKSTYVNTPQWVNPMIPQGQNWFHTTPGRAETVNTYEHSYKFYAENLLTGETQVFETGSKSSYPFYRVYKAGSSFYVVKDGKEVKIYTLGI